MRGYRGVRWTGRIALSLVLGLTFPGVDAGEEPIPVVASFSILADMVRNVGAQRVSVQVLVPPASDTHAFRPRPHHVRLIRGARGIFSNGAGFEVWLDRLLAASSYEGPVFAATEGLPLHRAAGGVDPHAWHSPALALGYVENIRRGLAAIDPAGARAYAAGAGRYAERIRATDAELRAALRSIPAPRRRVVTTHDAFGYLGRAYRIDMLSLLGWRGVSDPSAADVARLVRQTRSLGARAVFLERIADPRISERLARETGATLGGTLYADALSEPSGPAASYLELMRHNVQTIVEALRQH